MPNRMNWRPFWTLWFLSPIVGELLSGSTPLLGFMNPLVLLMLCTLYGGGAILCRELRVRWAKGWGSLFILAAAYGIVEEGLFCKSFFDPAWKDLGANAHFGRLWEVNWPWAFMLTIFHMFLSLSLIHI